MARWLLAGVAAAACSRCGAFESKYFLTEDELATARFGVPRGNLTVASADNSVRFLPDGELFMSRLYEVLGSTSAGDFVYATLWDVNAQMILRPLAGSDAVAQEANEAARLANVLAAAKARNVTVHLLVTSGLLATGEDQCRAINQKCGAGTCIMDDRHGLKHIGSNHEKIWLVRLGSRLLAFTGSMDVTAARWDTNEHDITSARWQAEPRDSVRQFAWHGTMYEIEGMAAEDIYFTFIQRWNDPIAPKSGPLPPLDAWRPSAQDRFAGYPGKLSVQVVRTFSCQGSQDYGLYQTFAPYGEYSYAKLWFKVLQRAKEFIYVADQFMWYDEALEAVVEAAEHVDFVIVLTNRMLLDVHLSKGFKVSVPGFGQAVRYYQYNALIKALERRDPSGKLSSKVRMFNMFKEGFETEDAEHQIYDHEKTLIIDDELALVGSTGVERVGFTNDAELSIAIDSKDYVAGLRRRMFGEILRLSPNDPILESPQSAYEEWLRQADSGTMRVKHYVPDGNINIAEKLVAEGLYQLTEGDGRCQGSRFRPFWPAVRAGAAAAEEDSILMV